MFDGEKFLSQKLIGNFEWIYFSSDKAYCLDPGFCCPHSFFRLYSLVFNKVYKTAYISLGFADYLQFDYIFKYCANTVNNS